MPKPRPIDLKRLNIADYLFNKKVRDTATFIFSPTQAFYSLKGQVIPKAEFEAKYSLEIINTNPKGKNPDGRANFYQ